MSLISRIQGAWNAFLGRDPTANKNLGVEYYTKPDRIHLSRGNERSIITAIYNRIALDVASVDIKHVRLDSEGRYLEDMDSYLNQCLTLEANIDQTSRAFIQDVVLSMFDEGCVAIIPIDTIVRPKSDSYDISTMRTGKVIGWYPEYVKVRVYNDLTGSYEEITLPKRKVAIIENPFYAVMNEPSSTMQRLIRKLRLLDSVDEQTGANRLDVIIQLPYTIRSDARREQAENRRKEMEDQLSKSKYGVAYADATEHITQLNRPVENQLLQQVEYLTALLYSQLNLTDEILNGSANESTMNNYYNRTVEPILSAIVESMRRSFLTKTARTQHQSICYFRDPFKLMPISQVAEIADKYTRNEIMTSNEIRQIVGMQPAKDPEADILRNKNLSQPKDAMMVDKEGNKIVKEEEHQNGKQSEDGL